MRSSKWMMIGFLCLLIAGARSSQAGPKTWRAATTGDWFTVANWMEGVDYPRAGDDVVITNAGSSVLLTNSTEYLGSLTLRAPGVSLNTLVFSNWNTTLSVTNITIQTNGVVTLPATFTTNAGVMSNNVYIICSNLTIAVGGKIIADGKGYAGGAVGTDGYGLGGGKSSGAAPACGGGYGGFSANASDPGKGVGSFPYGSADTPFQPGSGGGGARSGELGGAGGGAIRIEAAGFVTNNGTISANGASGAQVGYGGGGGSGGGIYIQCYTFGGAGGVVSANGGDGWNIYSTPGGGGRIALNFNLGAQSAVPAVSFQSYPGRMGASAPYYYYGDIGTIYFPGTNLLNETLSSLGGQVIIPDFNAWSVNNLMVSNVWVRFPNDGFVLNVAQDLTVTGTNGNFGIGGSTSAPIAEIFPFCVTSPPAFKIGGNLILTNKGCLSVYSAMTNSGPGTTNFGALVSVTGGVFVASGSWIYPYSHPTNGGSPYFQMKSLSIATNAGINADRRGFGGGVYGANGYGPGRSVWGAQWINGAGYGGFGGDSYNTHFGHGLVYGSATAPIDPGSGSGGFSASAASGGNGGGAIRMDVRESVVVNGTISANGARGGSGGGIYITCDTFTGTNGLISTDGGVARNAVYGGSGGGGRIAVVYTNTAAQHALPVPVMRYTAAPDMTIGVTARGDLGTLYFPDNYFLSENLTNMNGQIFGVTSWSPGRLLLSNNWVRFSADGVLLNVTNDVKVDGVSGLLEIGGSFVMSPNIVRVTRAADSVCFPVLCSTSTPSLTVGGNLILTNGGSLGVYCAPTNMGAGTTNYGGLVSVARDMVIGANSWVYPQSHPTNGGSVIFMVNNLFMADTTNAGFNAYGRGYAGAFSSHVGFGPGCGPVDGTGGGYGGRGGGSYYRSYEAPPTYGGPTYGSSNAPVDPGSGGWSYQAGRGGNGGGSIRIIANRTVAANGMFWAEGQGLLWGMGSGGGIYITCRNFTGTTNGILNAKGGDSAGGNVLSAGGGGGRIAVWRVQESPPYLGSWTVTNGFSYTNGASRSWTNGAPGTMVWGWLPPPGTVILLR